MTVFSLKRETATADLEIRVGPFWLHVDRDDEAIVGFDLGPLHGQSSVDLGPGHPDEERA